MKSVMAPAQTRVLDLLVQGLSNKEIAEKLWISVKAVDFQLRLARDRSGKESRVELAFWWRDNNDGSSR